jgi:hypothetical protein
MMVQVADRLAYERLEDDDRREFIIHLAKRVADHMQENVKDIMGEADYWNPFIAMLNVRAEGYAEHGFDPHDGASYGFLHYFGTHVQKIMGDEHHANRWVIDQVMDIDGPEAVEKVTKAVDDLFS